MNLLPFIGKKKGSNATQWVIVALIIGAIVFLIWWFLIRKPKTVINPGYGGTTGSSSPILMDTVRTVNDELFTVIDGFFSSAESKNDAAALAYGFSNAQIVALAEDWQARYAPNYGSSLYTAMDNEFNVPYLTAGANYWEILKERLKTVNSTN